MSGMLCFAVTMQMMKWQPAVKQARNSDGTYDDEYLFDKVRQLAADNEVANVQSDLLMDHDHAADFIDEVLVALYLSPTPLFCGHSVFHCCPLG